MIASHRLGAKLRAGFAALAALGVLAACSSSTTDGSAAPGAPTTPVGTSTSPSAPVSSSHSRPVKVKPTSKPVHVSLQMSDGTQVGVGMPIIAYLSRPIKDAHAFAAATKVTVNGKPVKGAWYFESKAGLKGKPVEADYRTENYWPANANIHMSLPVKNLTAGTGLLFADSLTLDFSTGPANVLTVDDAKHTLTVVSDNTVWGTFKVSLGASATPTRRGTKVIMEKQQSTCMTDTASTYYECGVKWTERLTYDGEYLHSAPWNCTGSPGCTGPSNNIGSGNSSNGCTNLTPADAEKLYNFTEVGDVVKYPNSGGPLMQLGDGYGDWNVPWPQWLGGGLYRTS